VAVNDAFNVNQDSTANLLDVKANDSDPDGDLLSIVAVGLPSQGGTVILNDNGTPGDTTDDFISYTPAAGFTGTEVFTYDLSDGQLISQATVTVTVDAVNAAPVAVNDAFNVNQDSTANLLDVKANDSDPDGDLLSIVAVGSRIRAAAWCSMTTARRVIPPMISSATRRRRASRAPRPSPMT
jgi:large repetitive protein